MTLKQYEKQLASENESEQEGLNNEALTQSTPIGFTNQRQMTPHGFSNSHAYEKSQKSNLEDPTSDIDRSTQLHKDSTTIGNQMNSF